MNSQNLKNFFGFATIALIWGSTWLAIRIGLESLTPIISAGFRFSLAAVILYIIMRINGTKIQTDRLSINLYIIMGFFSFVIPFGLVYWGETVVPSGLASVLFASYPLFIVVFSRLAMKEEKVNFAKIAGVLLGFIGIVIIFSEDLTFGPGSSLMGMLAVTVSAIMQAGIAVLIKKRGHHLNPLSMNLVPIIIAGIFMTIGGLLFEDTSSLVFDMKALATVAYLAVFGTIVSFTTYYWLLKRLNVVILSFNTFITPIIAVILGWLILDENLSSRMLAGSSLVLIGILFANLRGLINYYSKKLSTFR